MGFKPSARVINDSTVSDYERGKCKLAHIYVFFPTYRKLKGKMKELLEKNHEKTITVSRSRRGEWGEWYEIWELRDDKPAIVKKGWM